MHLSFHFSLSFFEQFGEHRSIICQKIKKQEATPVTPKKFAYESEQDLVVTGNQTATRHH